MNRFQNNGLIQP